MYCKIERKKCVFSNIYWGTEFVSFCKISVVFDKTEQESFNENAFQILIFFIVYNIWMNYSDKYIYRPPDIYVNSNLTYCACALRKLYEMAAHIWVYILQQSLAIVFSSFCFFKCYIIYSYRIYKK